jgi:hypothetical protein
MGGRTWLALGFLLAVQSGQAQEFASPEDLLTTLYRAYLLAPITNLEPYFSDELSAQMSGGRLDGQVMRQLGFDPILGLDEPALVTTFNLNTIDSNDLTATSVARFYNGGKPVKITFALVRETDHGWQIDHMSGQAAGVSWCSNDLVAAARAVASQ